MRQMTTRQSRKSGTWPVTGKNARYSVKRKMSLSNMWTMITSRRIAKTLPATGMHAPGKRNHLKRSTCWLCTCAGTLEKSHINAAWVWWPTIVIRMYQIERTHKGNSHVHNCHSFLHYCRYMYSLKLMINLGCVRLTVFRNRSQKSFVFMAIHIKIVKHLLNCYFKHIFIILLVKVKNSSPKSLSVYCRPTVGRQYTNS